MRLSISLSRPLALMLLATAVVGMSGCKWFKKGARGDYALAPEARPLEVPPDLNLPNTAGAMQVPAATGGGGTGGSATGGFAVAGSRDEVFAKVGDALAAIEGVTIASRAQLLGSYDVGYEGGSFLVQVAAAESGARVSVVDPRGVPASGPAAAKLIAALKTRLGG